MKSKTVEIGEEAHLDTETLRRLYWSQKFSARQLAAKFGIPKATILRTMQKQGIPRRKPHEATILAGKQGRLGNFLPRNNFVLVNSFALAYIIGVYLGDGCAWVNSRGTSGRFRLGVVDKEFADECERNLKTLGMRVTNIQRASKITKCGYVFVVDAGSSKFAKWLLGLSWRSIESRISLTRKTKVAFIRGFYDSEGYDLLPFTMTKSSTWRVGMGCKEKSTMMLVSRIIKSLGYAFIFRRNSTIGMYYLNSCNKDQNRAFLRDIHSSIDRKRQEC